LKREFSDTNLRSGETLLTFQVNASVIIRVKVMTEAFS